eukprot:TRINITY_DN13248_c0_g1_i1.p1 TRINITY_DN13248_c0_g1~~TRINITY_DN13248_c0_g1_i1.p1  ORF type:complete len:848 (+),score=123.10 TRINITY_DN13248_c0_g1_i1:50-2545(+)
MAVASGSAFAAWPGGTTGGVPMSRDDLDATITDPLTAEERSALTRIRQHSDAVSAVRAELGSLSGRKGATGAEASMAELRRVVEQADRVEVLLGVSREVLAKEALASDWPAEELRYARRLVVSIDEFESASHRARMQLEAEVEQSSAATFVESLEALLNAWGGALQIYRDVQANPALAANNVAVGMDSRANLLRPLLDALLDKASEIRTILVRSAERGLSDDAVKFAQMSERLGKLFNDTRVRGMLHALSVEVPDFIEGPVATVDSRGGCGGCGTGSFADSRVDDPLMHTIPKGVEGSGCLGSGSVGPRRTAPAGGSPEVWRAVHVGDFAAVTRLIAVGACDATMRDASGHSVFWHAIAFQHMDIANAMLDAFSPNSQGGVAVHEVHARKGDTLLHVLCQSQRFGQETATVFKRIAAAARPELFQRVNAAGFTFMQIAASSLNFWVLTFMFRNLQTHAKALVCMANHPPMKCMADRIADPAPPSFQEPPQIPDCFRVSEMLQQDEFGSVPYADLAFDVGPDNGGVAAGRFLAHRVVVSSQSAVLFEALAKAPLTPMQREGICAAIIRIDARISKDVWRSALQFMYTGKVPTAFQNDVEKSIDLLRACVLYRLPAPLRDFAQHCIYPLLPNSPPQIAHLVFTICCSTSSQEESTGLRPAKEASAYILLRSAHRLFENAEPQETCHTLEKVVQTVEQLVFNPVKQPSPPSRTVGEQSPIPNPTPRSRPVAPAQDIQAQEQRNAPSLQQVSQPMSHGGQPLRSSGSMAGVGAMAQQTTAMHAQQYHQGQVHQVQSHNWQPNHQPPSPYLGQRATHGGGGYGSSANGVFRMQSWA